METNQKLFSALKETSDFYKLAKDPHRANTYEKAAKIVQGWPTPIKSGKDLSSIKGVGKSLMTDIDHFLAIGTTTRLEILRNKYGDRNEVMERFMNIYGVGPVKAGDLYDRGFRKVEDLIPIIDTFTEAQQWGIVYYDHLLERIPRSEIDETSQLIDSALKEYWPNITWEVVGSYRRGESSSGDIDIIIRQDDPSITLKQVVDVLKETDMMVATLASKSHKFMGIWRVDDEHWARRIDILVSPPKEWPFATLYFTGSKELNVLMRSRAQQLNMTLNEKRLLNTVTGEIFSAICEVEIFSRLHIQYIRPVDRTRCISQLPLIPFVIPGQSSQTKKSFPPMIGS